MLSIVKDTLVSKRPLIISDNIQLIDICMAYNLITEQQAVYYYLNDDSSKSLVHFIGDVDSGKKKIIDINEIMSGIVYILDSKKVDIPASSFTYQWFYDIFKDVIGKDETVYSVFYDELKGSLTSHIAYSSQLQYFIDLNRKKISIVYEVNYWKELVGSRIIILNYYKSILKRQTEGYKVMKAQ